MGCRARAERISNEVSEPSLKPLSLHVFDRCGCCDKRIRCIVLDTLRRSNGDMTTLIEEIDSLVCEECATISVAVGVNDLPLPNTITSFLKKNCGQCDRLEACLIVAYESANTKVSQDTWVSKAKRCVACEHFNVIVWEQMFACKLDSMNKIISFYGRKFIECDR